MKRRFDAVDGLSGADKGSKVYKTAPAGSSKGHHERGPSHFWRNKMLLSFTHGILKCLTRAWRRFSKPKLNETLSRQRLKKKKLTTWFSKGASSGAETGGGGGSGRWGGTEQWRYYVSCHGINGHKKDPREEIRADHSRSHTQQLFTHAWPPPGHVTPCIIPTSVEPNPSFHLPVRTSSVSLHRRASGPHRFYWFWINRTPLGAVDSSPRQRGDPPSVR